MSVAGIDIGDQASCIAVARKRGVDVLLNKESKRETPTLVSFGAKQRQLGTDAYGSLSINPKNTIFGLKRLLGKKFQSPDVQSDIQRWPFKVTEGPDGGCLVHANYLGEEQAFTPEQLVAMMIVDLKDIAHADGSAVTDCVLSVPTFFTEVERYAMLNAAEIAGVNCLRLINDTTATALAYGIYKTDLPETDPVNVAFVDVGMDALQVSIVAFKKGQLRILSHAFDRNLGGRDFDEVLFEHFAEEFGKKYKLDIKGNGRASFRLRLACERLKKILSSIPEAPINVESLANDVDVSAVVTRDTFVELAKPVLERVKGPLEEALKVANLTPADVAAVEVVGGSSRIPAILDTIQEVFGKVPSRTLNAKEVISRGNALNCAMLSPIFRVKEFEVIDSFPFGVAFSWEKDGELTTSTLFDKHGPIPSAKMLTFYRDTGFALTADYTEDSPVPEGFDRRIGVWEVAAPAPPTDGSKAKLKVKVRLNLHGVVAVESVYQVQEDEYEETVKKAPKAGTKDEPMADAGAAAADEKMEDAVPGDEGAAPQAEGAPEATGDGAAPMDTDVKEAETEVVKKKRVKKLPLAVSGRTAGLEQKALQAFAEQELQMELQSKNQEETNERKNALEGYIYSLRNKLSDQLAAYVTDSDKEALLSKLTTMEDWLYDEGEDVQKSVYISKLEELQTLGGPIEARFRESETRPAAISSLTEGARSLQTIARSNDAAYAHIPQEEKEQVVAEAQKALDWLAEKKKLQEQARKTDEPVLLTSDIQKKADTLRRFAEPILSKPPPPAPKPEVPPEASKAEGEAEPMDSEPTPPEGDATKPSSVEEPMADQVD